MKKVTVKQEKVILKTGSVEFEKRLPVKLQKTLQEIKILLNIYETVRDFNVPSLNFKLRRGIEKTIYETLQNLMKVKYLNKLGKGVTATAWEFGSYVIRISNPWDDGGSYLPWANESMKKWADGYKGLYPKIHYLYTVEFENGLNCSIVIMEKLEPLKTSKVIFKRNESIVPDLKYSLTLKKISKPAKKYYEIMENKLNADYQGYLDFESFESIYESQKRIKFNDIHSGNIMWSRKRKSLVITDPSYY